LIGRFAIERMMDDHVLGVKAYEHTCTERCGTTIMMTLTWLHVKPAANVDVHSVPMA